jgi:hypothetical protein
MGTLYEHVGAISSDAIVSSRLGAPQGSIFVRLRVSVHDQLGPNQSGPGIMVGQHPHRSDWSGEPVKQVW